MRILDNIFNEQYMRLIGLKSLIEEGFITLGISVIKDEFIPPGSWPDSIKWEKVFSMSSLIEGQRSFKAPLLRPSGPGTLSELHCDKADSISSIETSLWRHKLSTSESLGARTALTFKIFSKSLLENWFLKCSKIVSLMTFGSEIISSFHTRLMIEFLPLLLCIAWWQNFELLSPFLSHKILDCWKPQFFQFYFS